MTRWCDTYSFNRNTTYGDQKMVEEFNKHYEEEATMSTFTTGFTTAGGVSIHDVPPEAFDILQTQFNAIKNNYGKTEWASFYIGATQITLFKDMKEESHEGKNN